MGSLGGITGDHWESQGSIGNFEGGETMGSLAVIAADPWGPLAITADHC